MERDELVKRSLEERWRDVKMSNNSESNGPIKLPVVRKLLLGPKKDYVQPNAAELCAFLRSRAEELDLSHLLPRGNQRVDEYLKHVEYVIRVKQYFFSCICNVVWD
jgi:hypothetical protein